MKSLVLTHDGLQIADTPVPPLMPGYVLIEIRSVGISRSDLQIWKGELDVNLPLILGHELAGIVNDSSDPKICTGSMVTAENHLSCGTCWYCMKNLKHLCNETKMLGVTADGALSEYLSVPADIVHIIPENIDTKSGTFIEPLATAIETYTRTSLDPDEDVLVIGTGKAGLLLSQVYDAFGANVHILGTNKWHLGLARQLGLRNTSLQSDGDWKQKLLDSTHGVGPRVVVEATGNVEGIQTAIDTVRNGGVIALTGKNQHVLSIDPAEIVRREISIIGSSRGSYELAINMLQKGRIEVKRLVSKEFTLEDGSEAFEYATKPEVVKVNINI